jgi:hypothetical protein
MHCHTLHKLVNEWWDSSIVDSDSIEGLEVMDYVEGAVLLFDSEPTGPVRGIGGLVYTSCNLLLEEVNDVVDDASRNGDVTLYPGCVCNGGDLDQCKVFVAEVSALGFGPGEG